MSATGIHLLLHNKCPQGLDSPLTLTRSPLIPGMKAPKFFRIKVGNSMSLHRQSLVITAQFGPGCIAAILPNKNSKDGVFNLSGIWPYIPGKERCSQQVNFSSSLLLIGSNFLGP